MKYGYLFSAFLALCVIATSCAAGVPGWGQVYFAYDLGTYNTEIPVSDSNNNWYHPGENFKTPVGLYNLMPDKVNAQIADMRASGMDYIVIHIAIADLSTCKSNGGCDDGYPANWVWGELVDDSQGQLRPMQQANLVAILNQVRAAGFRTVVIRFADYDAGYASWQEAKYQKAWNFIANTHRLVQQQMSGGLTNVLYDLGCEALGGTNMQAYVQRLWSDYTFSFGNDDTVGFSTIPDAAHLAGLSWYGQVKPKIYAFDVYNVERDLVPAWQALGSEGSKPIMLMETYQNDSVTEGELQTVLEANPQINLIAVNQWPNTRATECSGCDPAVRTAAIQLLNTTTQLSNYAPLADRVVTDNSDDSLLSFSDVNCASTTSNPCTLQANMAYAPANGMQDIELFVSGPDGVRKLVTCGGLATNINIPWIVRNSTYRFEYYRVSACQNDVPSRQADATTILSVR
ncbi:hypothetical protein DyAD56_18785 [Dyella sp. AD56]|nr:hypothetical protein DyAD56_18785 [Dyella sp. AD56]